MVHTVSWNRADGPECSPATRDTTVGSGLHLLAAGRCFRAVSTLGNRHVFVLPGGVDQVRVASVASSPRPDDRRPRGVAISRIIIRGGTDYIEVPVDHPALSQGWHAVESDGRVMWRWTDGDAVLPVEPAAGAVTIELLVRDSGTHAMSGNG